MKHKHTIPPLAKPMRFIDYTIGIFPTLTTRNSVKKAIKKGCLLLNHNKAGSGDWIIAGQTICYNEEILPIKKIFPLKLEVIFEDKDLALINKPAGYPVSGNRYKTIVNALPANLKTSSLADALPTPHSVHRLDEATSGLLLIAKTHTALHNLSSQFENKEIKKQYQTIVIGDPGEKGCVNKKIDEKEAITNYLKIATIASKRFGCLSWLHIFPESGRKHQIRKHLTAIGHPILGDTLYSPKELIFKGKGLFLCAVSISFTHPRINTQLTYTIDPPKKFGTLFRYFSKNPC